MELFLSFGGTKCCQALVINMKKTRKIKIFILLISLSHLTLLSDYAFGFRDRVQREGVTSLIHKRTAAELQEPSESYYYSGLSKRTTRTKPVAYLSSPLSNRLLEVGEIPSSASYEFEFEDNQDAIKGGENKEQHWNLDCQTIRSSVELIRHEHQHGGQDLARTCRGFVQVNRCEGSCQSSVQPSVKSPTGLKKECACCNEGSFKRVQVRLNECRNAQTGVLIQDDSSASFMDVILDEPSDCKCRPCDTII